MLRKVKYSDLKYGDKFYMSSNSEAIWVKTKCGYTVGNYLDMVGAIRIDGEFAYQQSETIGYMENGEVFVETQSLSPRQVELGQKFSDGETTYIRTDITFCGYRIVGVVVGGTGTPYAGYLLDDTDKKVYLVD